MGRPFLFWSYEFASSQYRVVFSVDVLAPYSFGVDNVDTGYPSFYGASGIVTLTQVDPSNPNLVIQSIYSIALGRDPYTGAGYPDVSERGVLAPGTYALRFDLHKGSHNYGDPGSAAFGLVMIPEPQASLLIAFGLVGLAGWRRVRA